MDDQVDGQIDKWIMGQKYVEGDGQIRGQTDVW